MFAYRTRVHTTTSYTPFELLFGRKANGFENWSTKKDEGKILELEMRGNEIKTLFEGTHPKAISNIENKQEKQKKIQNDRSQVVEEMNEDLLNQSDEYLELWRKKEITANPN